MEDRTHLKRTELEAMRDLTEASILFGLTAIQLGRHGMLQHKLPLYT